MDRIARAQGWIPIAMGVSAIVLSSSCLTSRPARSTPIRVAVFAGPPAYGATSLAVTLQKLLRAREKSHRDVILISPERVQHEPLRLVGAELLADGQDPEQKRLVCATARRLGAQRAVLPLVKSGVRESRRCIESESNSVWTDPDPPPPTCKRSVPDGFFAEAKVWILSVEPVSCREMYRTEYEVQARGADQSRAIDNMDKRLRDDTQAIIWDQLHKI